MLKVVWFLVGVVLMLAGCVPSDPEVPLAATKIGGAPALVAPLCDGEGVRSVILTESRTQDGDGPVLWQIDAEDRPVKRRTFVVGTTPPGFRQTRPPKTSALQRREITARILTDSDVELIGAVDYSQVKDSNLYVDLEQVSEQTLRKRRAC